MAGIARHFPSCSKVEQENGESCRFIAQAPIAKEKDGGSSDFPFPASFLLE